MFFKYFHDVSDDDGCGAHIRWACPAVWLPWAAVRRVRSSAFRDAAPLPRSSRVTCMKQHGCDMSALLTTARHLEPTRRPQLPTASDADRRTHAHTTASINCCMDASHATICFQIVLIHSCRNGKSSWNFYEKFHESFGENITTPSITLGNQSNSFRDTLQCIISV